MKHKGLAALFYLLLIIVILILLSGCGVILDNNIVTGKWKLVNAEFYQYNATLDTYKVIKSGSTVDGYTLRTGAFFWDNTSDKVYTLELLPNNSLELTRLKSTAVKQIVLNRDQGHSWSVSSYESSLSFNIKRQVAGSNIWLNGFELKRHWPMSSNKKLEIYIKASDLKTESISVNLDPTTGAAMEVVGMKGFFELQ